MSRVIPEKWLPDCQVQRVVIHWTAGTYHATNIDREHYHFLIEGDGTLLKGDCSVRDNLSAGDGLYAAHTRGLNTGSIGISCCAMQGAMERPFNGGRFPLQKEQYEALTLALADLAEHYHLQPVPFDMLTHAEVEGVYGKPQRGKWDITVLPWLPLNDVGGRIRDDVRVALSPQPIPREYPYSPVTIEVDGKEVSEDGRLEDGVTMAPVRPVVEAMGWKIEKLEGGLVYVQTGRGAHDFALPFDLRSDRAYVVARSVASGAGIPAPSMTKDGANRTLHYTTEKQ